MKMWVRTNIYVKQFYKLSNWNCHFCSSIAGNKESKNFTPLFFDKNVQQMLMTLTRPDYEKVFRLRKDGERLKNPKFKLMTDKELENLKHEMQAKLYEYLQMPPVVKADLDVPKVLVEDPGLKDHDQYNYVFTDISYGYSNKTRLVVVREPSGVLRYAKRDEKNRMNQVYFPIQGREMHIPKMFYDPYFKDLLNNKEYEFILDRAGIQFEPDDPEYHRITKEVFCEVNLKKEYNKLRSTRHFGSMVFNLVCDKNIDTLLVDIIGEGKIDEAALLVKLYHTIHPEANSSKVEAEGIQLIRNYGKLESSQRNNVEHAILMYEKLQENKKKLEEDVVKMYEQATSTDVSDVSEEK